MTTLLSNPFFFIKTLIKHLWMSISSIKFYERVFRTYKGYGIQYIFSLSIISSLFCIILFLDHISKIKNYLNNNIMSQDLLHIDHVIRQLPTIDYDGQKIFLTEETPLFINNFNNHKLLTIDPNLKLIPSDRIKIPIFLGDSTMIIKFFDSKGQMRYTLPIKYNKILGNHPQILTQDVIKTILATIFEKAPSLLIYLIFPIFSVLIFINVLLEKIFIVLMIYFITYFADIKASLKICIRMVLFASGVFTLFGFIIIFISKEFSTTLWILQTWANFLMILGILKTSGKSRFLAS